MRITTFADDSQGDAGGYEDRPSVALYLTPTEAHDLRVVLDDVIAGDNTREPGWHTHVRAWNESAEIVVFFDHDGADKEPPPTDVDTWLQELAADGTSIAVAVREVAAFKQVDQTRALEIVRQHPAWRDRL